jgi:hypothetical protein
MHHDWERGERIATVESPWVRLIAERWRDDVGRELDYWRVEHAHSVIVAAVQGDRLLLPRKQFRPGLGRATLDLPGGRLPPGVSPLDAAVAIAARELGLPPEAIGELRQLNREGWPVNSSFSDQLLFGVAAAVDPAAAPALPCEAAPADREGLTDLLRRLECLQCRAVVLELLLAAG